MTDLKKIFCIFLIPIFIGIITSSNNTLNDLIPEDYCGHNNDICIQAVSNIVNNLDENYNVCDDFYQYVCKRWEDNITVPVDMGFRNQYNEAYKKAEDELAVIMENTKHDSVIIQKMVNLYQSCISHSNRTYYYPETVKSFLTTIGGWPLIGQNISTDYDWMEAVASVFRHTDTSNIIFNVGTIAYNSTNEYLSLEQPLRSLMWLPDIDQQVTENFGRFIKKIVRRIYPQYSQNEQILQHIETTAEFCRRHMEILVNNINRGEGEDYQIISLGEFEQQTEMDFKKVIQLILKDEMVVNDDTKIAIKHLEYFKRLKGLISDYSNQTHVIACYIGLMATIQLQLEVSKIENSSPRSLHCLRQLFHYTTYAAGNLLANNLDRYTITLDVELMTNEIKEVIEADVNGTMWMDDNSKASFLNKLRNLQVSAIGPSWMDDMNFLEQYYSNIGEITTDNFLQNIIELEKFRKIELFRHLSHVATTDNMWRALMFNPRPFYHRHLNALYIPVLSLKPPFYHFSFNQAMKFGSLGTRIAEGIMHAFNKISMYYDENGNKDGSVWKEETTRETYESYINCLTESYNNFTTPLVAYQADVSDYVKENFASTTGLIQAYKAFKRLTERENLMFQGSEEKKINYMKQFFLNFVYMKCEKLTKLWNMLQLLKDFNFLTEKHRVIGSLANSLDFYQLFQCDLLQESEIFGQGRERCNFWEQNNILLEVKLRI